MNLIDKLKTIGTINGQTETPEGFKLFVLETKTLSVPCLTWITEHFELYEIKQDHGMFILELVL